MEVLTEALPDKKAFFTIDPYTTLSTYNQSLQALDNNKIDYEEWVLTINPFQFYLTLEKNQFPIMLNYDTITGTNWKNLVSKVKPLKQNDIYKLFRRLDNTSKIGRYVNNDVFNKALKSNSVVFQYKNKEQLFTLSKSYGIIYPLGKYINGSKRLAICFNKEIKNMVTPDHILLEKGPHGVGALELDINWKVLRNQDKIQKWIETPYFKDGKFYQTKPTSPLEI